MAKHTNLISRLLQLTALFMYVFAAYRLYRYFTNWLLPPEYMIYTIFAAIVIGTGILIFDDVFKPGQHYVGWAFLFGVGILSLVFGVYFTLNPYLMLDHPLTAIWLRAFFFLVMGVILVIESLLVKREVVKDIHGVNSDTVGPLLLKFISVFGLAFGGYQMSWVLVPFLRNVDLFTLMPLLISALGLILGCSLLIIYVETQKRQPHFRMRRLPLLMSLILLLMILPNTAIYLQIFFSNPDFANTVMTNLLFNAITALGVSVSLLITSFYIVYHPTKAR
ncbi:MAG: hypothetical protein ACXACH_06855 [Candidatus Hermodarchaeia archaeon]